MQEIIVTKSGILPIAQEFIDELNIVELFDAHIESGKEEISHGRVVNILLLNLLDSTCPLYKVSDWLSAYSDGVGEFASIAQKFHDKRLGATLDAIYESSRHSILTELSCRAIQRHQLETKRIHNDTTTVTFTGEYERDHAQESEVVLTRGYNKDHRPDYKQIVFGLNVSADGYVPLLAQLYSGNKSDSQTHQANWQALRELLGREDFTYIADSKLSSTENLQYIADAGGKFISILPANRKEVRDFYKDLSQIQSDDSALLPRQWEEVYRVKDSRQKGKFIVYSTKETKTKEGFRLIWVYSSAKAEQDAQRRQKAIEKAEQFLEELSSRLNRYYLKTKEQIQGAIDKNLGKTRQFFDIEIITKTQSIKKKTGRGRPGPDCKYKEQIVTTYRLKYKRKASAIQSSANTDGIFPLVSNGDEPAVEILKAYKNQPYLEKKFNGLKSVLEVAPVFLKRAERIEAMLLLYIIALMLIALIERRIKKNMEQQKVEALPILPQGMKSRKPTWSNIKFCFNNTILLNVSGETDSVSQHQAKGLGKHQVKVLELLDVPVESYHKMSPKWWKNICIRGR